MEESASGKDPGNRPAEDRTGRLLRALGPEWRAERGLAWSGAPPPWYLKRGELTYCGAPDRDGLFRAFAEARFGMASPWYLDMFPVPAALRPVRSEEELELLLEALYG